MSEPIAIQEALIYAMVTVSAADSNMTDAELKTIGDLVKGLPIFHNYDPEALLLTASSCGERLQGENGLSDVLTIIAESLPSRLYDTAYALAVEVAAADGQLEREELRFLQMLRNRLGLDRLTVAAIERSAIARFRTTKQS
ncbi:tellurite resistance TerB family protein [Pararhizobium sp. IMCC21322]|uniref:tellurite resistance TerB family protein n=1 Tax=Pararhizobium sp. IMCC21322 TaxID=3067903 RepID=UPI00274292AE|nr:tellurite resistance TerB family protein [Pararhizobium sp. IMCC21322]